MDLFPVAPTRGLVVKWRGILDNGGEEGTEQIITLPLPRLK